MERKMKKYFLMSFFCAAACISAVAAPKGYFQGKGNTYQGFIFDDEPGMIGYTEGATNQYQSIFNLLGEQGQPSNVQLSFDDDFRAKSAQSAELEPQPVEMDISIAPNIVPATSKNAQIGSLNLMSNNDNLVSFLNELSEGNFDGGASSCAMGCNSGQGPEQLEIIELD
jgi:hypothetical protein